MDASNRLTNRWMQKTQFGKCKMNVDRSQCQLLAHKLFFWSDLASYFLFLFRITLVNCSIYPVLYTVVSKYHIQGVVTLIRYPFYFGAWSSKSLGTCGARPLACSATDWLLPSYFPLGVQSPVKGNVCWLRTTGKKKNEVKWERTGLRFRWEGVFFNVSGRKWVIQ